MDKDTEKHVIDAVNKLNAWKKRPGITVIFDHIIKQNFIVSWENFKTTFDNLVALNAIIKREGKDSYYSNRENILPSVSNNNSFIEDMDIDEQTTLILINHTKMPSSRIFTRLLSF